MIGWREWAALPQLGIAPFRVKIDTGARSSSLHASHLTTFQRDGRTWVRFLFRSRSDKSDEGVWCEALSLGQRGIRSSSGELQRRHLIATDLSLAGESWKIEVSLADRQEMGFEMLVGRTAIRRRFLVDPGRSYLTGRPDRHRLPTMSGHSTDEEE